MPYPTDRARLASFFAVALAACGSEPAPTAEPAPVVAAAPVVAPPPAAPAPAVAPTTAAGRIRGAWDAYLPRTMLSIEVDETTLRIGPPGQPGDATTYTIVGEGDSVTMHTVDPDGEVGDEALVLIGANVALLGTPPRQMVLVRRGVDFASDAAALPLRDGRWAWDGGVTFSFRENGLLVTNNGTRDATNGYRVAEIGSDGLTVVHWTEMPGVGPMAHTVARLAITGDQMTWTYLPGVESRQLTRQR